MCNDVSFFRVKTIFKIAISIFLCFCITVIPFVQRVNAVVTTTTVVVVLILTLLTAMGITLVIADGSKYAFIEQKGSEFMQSKGYSGSFVDWIKGQSDIQIGLKVGFFMLAKDVVDRIKEFVSWLIPSPSSDTVIDFNNGSVTPVSQAIFTGTIVPGVAGYANFKVTGAFSPSADYVSSISDGTNTVTFVTRSRIQTTGRYQASTGNYSSVGYDFSANGSNFIVLCLCSEAFVNRGNACLPGIYFGQANTNTTQIELSSQSYSNLDYVLQINDFTVNSPSSDASAIVGDYNDLDDLTNSSIVGSDGTTTIYNTFYITQDGQALGSAQDIADIVGALQQALDDLNRRLEVIPQTAVTAAEGTVTPDYSDFDLGNLDLSGLGALLTTRFPFSIPWDFIRIFQTFVAEPEAPSWTVDLLPIEQFENVNTEITIDLGQYPLVGQISRYFCIIELCIGLCYVTKRLVWTA